MNKLFDHLRRKKKTQPLTAPENIKTIPLNDRQIAEAFKAASVYQPAQLIHACGQSTGKQREHNEDSLFAFSMTSGGEGTGFPVGLFIVADGMGGHQYGEVASSIATRVLAGFILKRFLPYIINPANNLDEPLQEIMRSAIDEVQRSVVQTAPGSGTTLTAALVFGQQMIIGHVGDSRAYAVYQDGRTDILTRDHSLVKRLEELGQISADEALSHPQRNVLYRAIGQGETLEADVFTAPFPPTGHLVICSDGLWSVVSDNHIAKIIQEAPTLHDACRDLVRAANDAGGPDNISVILVKSIG
jgi:serine/threonine protein phosphatase PrpC